MAQQLDLQEQEQLDELKAFWNQYGNLITWVLTLALAAFALWEGYLRLALKASESAGTQYAEVDKSATAGDAARTAQVFDTMKKDYGHLLGLPFLPVPVYTQQAGLLTAKVQEAKGQPDAAAATLNWVADNGDAQYAALARLRLAGVLADQKKFDPALAAVDAVRLPAFAALADDRRGDILLAKGDKDGAKKAYTAAWNGMDATNQYRFVVETKLVALGAAPAASAAASAASGAGQ